MPELDFEENFSLEDTIIQYKFPLIFFLLGTILVGAGILFSKSSLFGATEVEIIDPDEAVLSASGENPEKMVVEVSGAVENPGVYELEKDTRVEDALIAAGGISADADRNWIGKMINRAAKVVDGQKIYIPSVDDNANQQTNTTSANNSGGYQSASGAPITQNQGLININTASAKELESMWGIGPKTAENIIVHRPYSKIEDLLQNKILKSNVYERNKDLMTVY